MTNDQTPAVKPMIRRVTTMGAALLLACERAGIDTSTAAIRQKTEPAWTVTRREPRDNKRGRRR